MRVGFLGAGVMAGGMVRNLDACGHQVTVYNRTQARLEPLLALGARAASTPAEAATDADIVASCVTDAQAVKAVWLARDGALSAMREGTLAIDLSTIAPGDAQALASACRHRGVAFIDAPVTGGEAGARDGTLTLFMGGEAADIERARPFCEAIGRRLHHVGPVGSGQAVKLVQNLVGGLTLVAAAEGAALAQAYGLDAASVLGMLGETTAQSRSVDILLDRLRSGRTEPGFSVRNRLKDFRLAQDMARACVCPLPLAAVGTEIMTLAEANGLGELDQTAVVRVCGRRD